MTSMIILNLVVSIVAIAGLAALTRSAYVLAAAVPRDRRPEPLEVPAEELRRAA
jgi:hypothetical protein